MVTIKLLKNWIYLSDAKIVKMFGRYQISVTALVIFSFFEGSA